MRNVPVSNYLRTHRRHTGLSQDDVAFLLGGSTGSMVSRHERARRMPTLRTALSCEIVLGVPVRELFAGEYRRLERLIRRRAEVLARRLDGAETAKRRSAQVRALAKRLSHQRHAG